jgi:hypothetical protein
VLLKEKLLALLFRHQQPNIDAQTIGQERCSANEARVGCNKRSALHRMFEPSGGLRYANPPYNYYLPSYPWYSRRDSAWYDARLVYMSI